MTISSPQTTALGAIVIQPEMCEDQYLMSSACVIGAQWVNTTYYLRDPTSSASSAPDATTFNDNMFYGTTTSMLGLTDLAILPDWSQPSITLSVPWATSLDQVTDVQNRTVSDNLLRLMLTTNNICPDNGSYVWSNVERPYMHERLLATMVVNGMAHAGSPGHLCFPNNSPSSWECPDYEDKDDAIVSGPQGVVLMMKCSAPGYAWNLDGVPIKIALVILIIYCIYIGGFVIYTFVSGRPSMTWRKLSDLTALAINSEPTSALTNTSCGIEKTGTFRNMVGLREGERRRLELVFKGDADSGESRYASAVVGSAY